MKENNTNEEYLSLKDILNENLLRDLIIFVVLFLFILTQSWNDLFLLLFPLILFTMSMTFRIINTNKWRIFLANGMIFYNPLGSEKKHADRLYFSSILLLIMLFWIGSESVYHPQLIDDYTLYFNILFILIYTFGFYWILIDIWKNAKIEIISKEEQDQDITKVLSSLGREKSIHLSVLNLIIFIILNVVNVLVAFLINFNLISGISYYLPGTGIEGSLPLEISISHLFFMIISPCLAVLFLFLIHQDIQDFNIDLLNDIIQSLPERKRNEILQNLSYINKKKYNCINQQQ
ncbi:MAG: hypothetical protein KGD66_09320 [Candidatus Lokiarchaeota archaeon]|nr:hypothetical protein [Candidatus Lokiarchaeota archaeon]